MATNYQIKVDFFLADKASNAISAVGKKGQWLEEKFSKPLLAAEERFNSLGAVAKKAVIGTFGAVATSAAVAIKSAIPLGMELEQNLGGTEAVFGDYAQAVQTLSEQAYKNMGLSASDYMATANKMGSLFQGSGLEQVRAMELSTQAMQRAADVASVMGIDATMAMESIAGAAKGNFTMMDNLGVAMNATTLQAYALEKGINFKWNTATNAEKAELAMQMFFERTEQYAGNFAREADETLSGAFGRMKTNVQDILANMALGRSIDVPLANMKESVLAFAHNVVPAVVNIINQLPDVIIAIIETVGPTIEQALSDIRSPFGKILTAGLRIIQMIWAMKIPIITIGALFLAWHGIVDVIFMVTKAMKAWEIVTRVIEGIQAAHNAVLWGTTVAIEAQGAAGIAAAVGMKIYAIGAGIASAATTVFSTAMGALNAVFVASPIGWIVLAIVAAIAALVAIIVLCVKHWDSVVAALKRVGEWFLNLGSVIGNFISTVWTAITGFFTNLYHSFMTFLFGENAGAVEEFIASIFEKIGNFFAGIWEKVTSFFSGIWERISAFFIMIGEAIGGFFIGIWERITTAFAIAADAISSFFGGIWERITGFFVRFGETLSSWIENIKSLLQPLFDWIDGLFDGIITMWQGFVSVFQSEGLVGVFKRIGMGILSFILTPIEKILSALTWIPGVGGTIGSWADSIAEMKGGLSEQTSFTNTQIAQQAPTRTAAVANSYSRQDNYTTNSLDIRLAEGLEASTYGSVAPGVTLQRTASGAF